MQKQMLYGIGGSQRSRRVWLLVCLNSVILFGVAMFGWWTASAATSWQEITPADPSPNLWSRFTPLGEYNSKYFYTAYVQSTNRYTIYELDNGSLTLNNPNAEEWTAVGGFATFDNKVYINFRNDSFRYKLYEYNGSTWSDITGSVVDGTSDWDRIEMEVVLDDAGYYSFQDGGLYDLWVLDNGSWSDITPNDDTWDSIFYLGQIGAKEYFSFGNTSNRDFIYELDGGVLTPITPAGEWSAVSALTEYNGNGYVSLRDADVNNTDTVGTYRVYEYNGTTWNDVSPEPVAGTTWERSATAFVFENKLYYPIKDNTDKNYELWRLNGSNWSEVTPTPPATFVWGGVSSLGEIDGKYYVSFQYSDNGNEYDLYEIENDSLTDITPTGTWWSIGSPVQANGNLYFVLQDKNDNREYKVYERANSAWDDVTPAGGANWDQGGSKHLFQDNLYYSMREDPGEDGGSDENYQVWELSFPSADLTIVLDATPEDDTTFGFTGSNGLGSFNLQDASDNTITFAGIDPGSYSIAETVPADWSLDNISCTGGSPTPSSNSVSLTLADGDNVTCTFTNRLETGTVEVVLAADPEDDTTFSFGGDLGAFDLQDPSNNIITFTDVRVGSYTITETVPADWSLDSQGCTGGTSSTVTDGVNITLADGETITCTFTNRLETGTVEVVMDATPADDTSFGFMGDLGTFTLQDPSNNIITFTNVRVGSYTVTETVPADWSLDTIACSGGANSTGATSATVTLADGETIRCTFTNRLETGTVEVILDATPADDTSFSFGGDLGTFNLQDPANNIITFTDVRVGSYTITETVPSTWALDNASCTGGVSSNVSDGVTVTVADGETLTCTFTNRQQVGDLTIVLSATPEDDTLFSFGGDLGSFDLQDPSDNTITYTNLVVGSYTVTETLPAEWNLDNVSCDSGSVSQLSDGATVTIGDGDDITCTYNNRLMTGTVTVVLESTPEDDTTFNFGGDLGVFALQDPSGSSTTFTDVVIGSYTITETVPADWALASAACTGGSTADVTNGVQVTVTDGANVVCTFRNISTLTPIGNLTIVLDATPEDDTLFSFTGDGGLGGFDLQDPSNISQTFIVEVGSYTVTETIPADWSLDNFSCDSSFSAVTNGVTVSVGDGADVTCTFTNRLQTGNLTVVLDASPEDDTVFGFGGDLGAFDLQDPADNSVTFTDVRVGSYALTETVPADWNLDSATCDGTFNTIGDGVNVTIADGEDVTCTFVNRLQTGSITVVLEASPEDNTTFGFIGDMGAFDLQDPADNSVTFTEVRVGSYAITETIPAGWDLTNASCVGGSGHSSTAAGVVVNLTDGDAVTCTFSNINNSVATGNLSIALEATPADDTQFDFSGDGSIGAFSLQDPTGNQADYILVEGTYTITQTVPAMWQLNSVSCVGGSATAVTNGISVTITDGDNITCTFVNQQGVFIYLPLITKP